MVKWEYKTVRNREPIDSEKLTSYGSEGWEIIDINFRVQKNPEVLGITKIGEFPLYVYTFKRQSGLGIKGMDGTWATVSYGRGDGGSGG